MESGIISWMYRAAGLESQTKNKKGVEASKRGAIKKRTQKEVKNLKRI